MKQRQRTSKELSVFISYAHEDEYFKNELLKHLEGIKRNKLITTWDDSQILPGQPWDAVIKQKLAKSDIIIFLISADFLASAYCNEVEIKKAIGRHKKGEATLIPIIVRHCDFESSSLSQIQALPKFAKPVASWEDQDEAWLDVVKFLKILIAKPIRVPTPTF